MIAPETLEAVEAQDTTALLRAVDRLCKDRRWDDLIELRLRCQEALTRGRQLWGVDEHIRYRLALEAPPSWAGPAVTEGPSRFTLGPLAEVAASTRSWDELEEFLEPGPSRMTVAAERVVRGESIEGEVADLPGRLQPWEPEYRVATYHADRVETPSPDLPAVEEVRLPDEAVVVDDPDSEAALADLVGAWLTESNGRCQTATVSGGIPDVLKALGLPRARLGRLTGAQAVEWMAWAAASGGAHGRRRGAAAGRYGAWWAVATVADLDWPPSPDLIGSAVERIRWAWFDDGSPPEGWQLRLALEDPASGLAWAVSALDQAD